MNGNPQISVAILVILFLFSALGANCSVYRKDFAEEKYSQTPRHNLQAAEPIDSAICWYPARPSASTKGVALVIHGLNLKPDKMESIISLLVDDGIDVLNLTLRGHGNNYSTDNSLNGDTSRIEAFKEVSYQLWIEETKRAYRSAVQKSRENKGSLFLVGFSLGGLMGADLFAAYPDVHFDKMVLFAPALNLHKINYAAKLLSPFPNLTVPSLASKSYRANRGTPVAAYNALFDTIEHFRQNLHPKLNVPTLIFIDKGDELVSYNKLKCLVENERFDKWTFHPVQKGTDVVRGTMRHLIIDEPSVGRDTWKEMRIVMLKHLLP